MFTVGGAEFTVGGAVFTVGGAQKNSLMARPLGIRYTVHCIYVPMSRLSYTMYRVQSNETCVHVSVSD